MSTSTIVDLCRHELGRLEPELITRSFALDELISFAEKFEQFWNMATIPARPDYELRPLIAMDLYGLRSHQRPDLWTGFLSPDDFIDRSLIDRKIDLIIRQLLYCHSLSIDNPLRGILDPFIRRAESTEDRFRSHARDAFDNGRQQFAGYLDFLCQVQPLVDSGVLILVEGRFAELYDNLAPMGHLSPIPDPYGRPTSDYEGVVELRRLLAEVLEEFPSGGAADLLRDGLVLSDSDFPERVLSRVGADSNEARVRLVRHAVQATCDYLLANAFHADRFDLYFPFPYFQEAARWVFSTGQRRTLELLQRAAPPADPKHDLLALQQRGSASSIRTDDRHLLGQLMTVPLPRLDELTIESVVALRNHEGFDDWRSSLRTALHAADASPWLSDEALGRAIRDNLRSSAERLTTSLQGGKAGKLGRAGVMNFGVGSTGVLAAAALHPVGAAVVLSGVGSAAGKEALSFVWKRLKGDRQNRADEPLRQHFLVLEPPTPR